MSYWIDVHAHLNMLEDTPAETVKKSFAVGVEKIITIGTEPDDWDFVLQQAKTFPGQVFATLGLHPHSANLWTDELRSRMQKDLKTPGVVALGEMGLDCYRNECPLADQIRAFEEQLEIAAQNNLPVEIHTRDAEEQTINCLKKFSGRVRGIIHCFTGTQWLADQALDIGFNISISGVVTFKNAEALRDVVRRTPLDRMHVETDAPFLAPVPMRGKKNVPAFVVHTAQCVSELKGVTLAQLQTQCLANAQRMFRI